MTNTTHKIHNEGSDYESLEFKSRHSTLRVESKDHEGEIEFEMEDCDCDHMPHYVFLNQEQAKLLIAHLQKQII